MDLNHTLAEALALAMTISSVTVALVFFLSLGGGM
jgi:hypothetical protein